MNEFLQTASTTNFWLSVVLVGLIINLASSYLKPLVNQFCAWMWTSWQRRSIMSMERQENLMRKLATDKHEELMYLGLATSEKLDAIYSLCIGIVAFVLASVVIKDPPAGNMETFSSFFHDAPFKGIAIKLVGTTFITWAIQSSFKASSKFALIRFVNEKKHELLVSTSGSADSRPD